MTVLWNAEVVPHPHSAQLRTLATLRTACADYHYYRWRAQDAEALAYVRWRIRYYITKATALGIDDETIEAALPPNVRLSSTEER
jgi:hypothetical protein